MNCQEFWNAMPERGDGEDSRHLLECPPARPE